MRPGPLLTKFKLVDEAGMHGQTYNGISTDLETPGARPSELFLSHFLVPFPLLLLLSHSSFLSFAFGHSTGCTSPFLAEMLERIVVAVFVIMRNHDRRLFDYLGQYFVF
jgi:hypothetical protein